MTDLYNFLVFLSPFRLCETLLPGSPLASQANDGIVITSNNCNLREYYFCNRHQFVRGYGFSVHEIVDN